MISAQRFSVSSEPVCLIRGDSRCSIRNRGDAAIYLGNDVVSADDGFQLDPGEAIGLKIRTDDWLYAVAASGSQEVHVLSASS